MNKIQKFIKDNNLSLDGYGSDLNSTCCIIAGYALYENGDSNDFEKLVEDITEDDLFELNYDNKEELMRVFDYAYQNNYGRWWHTEEAKSEYIFDQDKTAK